MALITKSVREAFPSVPSFFRIIQVYLVIIGKEYARIGDQWIDSREATQRLDQIVVLVGMGRRQEAPPVSSRRRAIALHLQCGTRQRQQHHTS
ncbi:hypothetical protein LSTR_LSTR000559 [Laodelphax striatellus]|uniref:Uncharacterized protein n=1 Tax=Laodelphax striatellus TaxID=195883 RepID=A0A482XB16_LAOST|nr:hypothetical protein LSTR_LSTR000559 [Laodelphax striatellus]